MTQANILIVDDEPDIRELISDILADEDYRVTTATNGHDALKKIKASTPDLVLLDIWMPEMDGITLLKKWHESGAMPFAVVMMSGHGTIETAIEATKMGAADFVEKPISLAKLLQTIETTLKQHQQVKNLQSQQPQWQMMDPVGNSKAAVALRETLKKLAKTQHNVLLYGDAGTGKSTTALLIHHHRHHNKSVTLLDSLSLDEDNMDAALAQHRPDSASSCVIANIDCLTGPLQQKLLSRLKQWQKTHQHNRTQVLTTSQQDLTLLIEQGDFSRDLYDCLAEFVIYLPPLQQRSEDVPELLNFYVNHLPDIEQTPYRKLSVAAQNYLRHYEWPGNLRELKNLVRQLQLAGGETEIQQSEVESFIEQNQQLLNSSSHQTRYDLELREAREEFERDYLLYHLQKVDGKVGDLAKISGMERTNLYRKLRALDINPKNISSS
ncbi:sigma-54-dependent transcriptional regulator [Marinicella gelatinilytica]|uniref:sigma-54-dependent transcriptional regulator n=1 Tax=Marinicella gelatinilytica TaxID=2996017 RepID=UPI002260D6FA|nr:sigma-54 dependent transcriptional regulator [Marinicella gelatinilytica]MCX7544943.1 sigma-54 dependent transcriptional regulator [Marinicella gelatinilytica]